MRSYRLLVVPYNRHSLRQGTLVDGSRRGGRGYYPEKTKVGWRGCWQPWLGLTVVDEDDKVNNKWMKSRRPGIGVVAVRLLVERGSRLAGRAREWSSRDEDEAMERRSRCWWIRACALVGFSCVDGDNNGCGWYGRRREAEGENGFGDFDQFVLSFVGCREKKQGRKEGRWGPRGGEKLREGQGFGIRFLFWFSFFSFFLL